MELIILGCCILYGLIGGGVAVGMENLRDSGFFGDKSEIAFWSILWPLLIPLKLGMLLANAGTK